MVGQDEIQANAANGRQTAAGQSDREVAVYVLNMLNQMTTMADMAGHAKLASDIEAVLSEHNVEDY